MMNMRAAKKGRSFPYVDIVEKPVDKKRAYFFVDFTKVKAAKIVDSRCIFSMPGVI